MRRLPVSAATVLCLAFGPTAHAGVFLFGADPSVNIPTLITHPYGSGRADADCDPGPRRDGRARRGARLRGVGPLPALRSRRRGLYLPWEQGVRTQCAAPDRERYEWRADGLALSRWHVDREGDRHSGDRLRAGVLLGFRSRNRQLPSEPLQAGQLRGHPLLRRRVARLRPVGLSDRRLSARV